MFDKLIVVFYILSLTFLAFISGTIILHYKLPPSDLFLEAFESADAWMEKEQSMNTTPPKIGKNVLQAIKKSEVFWDKVNVYNGYTLISLRYSSTAFLLDMEGNIIYRWTMPFRKAWPKPKHINSPVSDFNIHMARVHAFPNGDLLATYNGIGDTPYGYGLIKIDKESNILWTYDANVHHDFYIDELTGNIFTLTQEYIKKAPKGFEELLYPMLTDFIVEISADGKELNKISVLESFADTKYSELVFQHPVLPALRWDRFHTNSIMKLEPSIANKFPMFKAGDLLISMRHLNAIAIIDPVTEKIVWAAMGPWQGQHAAHFLDNGNIILFDNQGGSRTEQIHSRIFEINPTNLAIEWSYGNISDQFFYTAFLGQARRLPNGNTLIVEALNSRVFEVNQDKKIVWNYQLPDMYSKPQTKTQLQIINLLRHPVSEFKQSLLTTKLNLLTTIMDANRYREEDLSFINSN